MSNGFSDIELERWRLWLEEFRMDADWKKKTDSLADRRTRIRPEILQFLTDFLEERITVENLRDTFDRKTRTEWAAEWGLKGLSGAMFLNKLVKHLSDQDGLTGQLRSVLRHPTSEDEARQRMTSLVHYIEDLIQHGEATRGELQPARISFFLPIWWHVRDPETWPLFFPSHRRPLEVAGVYRPSGEPVDDYFSFRRKVLQLASDLAITPSQLGFLCWWLDERRSGTVVEASEGTADEEPQEEIGEEALAQEGASAHTESQWRLAQLGRALGCRIWIPPNDRSKRWKNNSLADLSLDQLPPLGIDEDSQRHVKNIDVLWLKGSQITAAFEIECTTSIYSGLLRMSDLVALSPNLNFPLYIVTPRSRIEKVRQQLSRPTFQSLELHKRCGFFSIEDLVSEADKIARWANDPSAIERLASRVADA